MDKVPYIQRQDKAEPCSVGVVCNEKADTMQHGSLSRNSVMTILRIFKNAFRTDGMVGPCPLCKRVQKLE